MPEKTGNDLFIVDNSDEDSAGSIGLFDDRSDMAAAVGAPAGDKR